MKCVSICILCKTLAATPLLQQPRDPSSAQVVAVRLFFLFFLALFSCQRCIFSCFAIVTALARVCAGVCAACSVVPTRRVSTVSGRTTTLTVALVRASSLVQCAERTSWKRSCCCSVSTVIGGFCSLARHAHHRLTD